MLGWTFRVSSSRYICIVWVEKTLTGLRTKDDKVSGVEFSGT
jgi:hypothetical protein